MDPQNLILPAIIGTGIYLTGVVIAREAYQNEESRFRSLVTWFYPIVIVGLVGFVIFIFAVGPVLRVLGEGLFPPSRDAEPAPET